MPRGTVRKPRTAGSGFQARWYTTGQDGKRKQHSRSFKTKVEAERYLTRMLGDEDRGESYDRRLGETAFEAVAEQWLATLDPSLKPKTRAGYESIVHEHLVHEFGAIQIAAIKPGDIRRFLTGLQKKDGTPASPGTKRNVVRVLNPIMNLAVLDRFIRVNPVTTMQATFRMPGTRPSEMLFLTHAQVKQLADAIGPKYRPLILTAANTGLRAGELCALGVKDVDPESSPARARIRVRRQRQARSRGAEERQDAKRVVARVHP